MKKLLKKINHYIGLKLQPTKKYIINDIIVYDCTKDNYKVLVCNCTIEEPCKCISIINLKSLKQPK